jgi:hypothetical protein
MAVKLGTSPERTPSELFQKEKLNDKYLYHGDSMRCGGSDII